MCLINQTRTERSLILRQEVIYRDWASGLCRITRQVESWRISCTSSFRNLIFFLTMLRPVWQLSLKASGVSKPLDEPKAVIHTWLAWQEEPGRPFGTAIKARFLDPSVPEVDVLTAWLKRLFFPSIQSS